MFPNLTVRVQLHVSNEKLDESRLAGTVGAKNSDTRGERNLKGNVIELLHKLCWVLEANFASALLSIHFQNSKKKR